MRATKRIMVGLLLIALFFGYAVPVSDVPELQAKAKTVKLSKKKVTLNDMLGYKLKLKNVPKKAKVTWSISKGKNVIKLKKKKKTSVKIMPLKEGKAKVTAKVKVPKKKTKKLTCTVKIKFTIDPIVTPAPTQTPPEKFDPQNEPKFVIEGGVLKSGVFDEVYDVTIPDGVKEIGKGVFENTNIETIVIPEGVEKIDEKAFNECTRLKSVAFPSTMREVGKDAFFECVSLQTVRLNDGLIKLGAGSFFQCKSLKNIVIPSSVKELGDYTFAWCEKLESVKIDAALTEIPQELFERCNNLKDVNFPASVKKIGNRAFCDVGALNDTAKLPSELESIGDNAFDGCVIGDQVINAKYIGNKAFSGSMKKIKLGSAVTEIGDEAFSSCSDENKAFKVTIPASVKKIGNKAFSDILASEFKVASGNTDFKSLDGMLLTADGKKLISVPSAKSIVDLTIPDGVEEICELACQNINISGTITFPSSLKKIGKIAFRLTDAKTIVFNDGLESIGEEAFLMANEVKKIEIPDSVKEIGAGAFSQNASLKEVKLSKGLSEIGFEVFREDEKLKKITIPASVKTIDPVAFRGCAKLVDYSGITFEEGADFSVKDGVLYDAAGTKLIAYPAMIIEDPSDEIKRLVIPDGVKEIGGFSIPDDYGVVEIPDSVEKIAEYAVGYKARKEDVKKMDLEKQLDTFHILSSSKGAMEYAKKHHVNIVSEEDPEYFYNGTPRIVTDEKKPEANVKKISLKVGETFDMKAKGILTDVYYSSSDKKIANVDKNGKITALANGTTSIVETSERLYLSLEVSVTGGSDPVYDDGLTTFVDEDEESVAAWEQLYFRYNPRLWFTMVDYPATNVYSGNDYTYVNAPYFGVDSQSYKSLIEGHFGKGNGRYFITISENLDMELSEPWLNQDILMFSRKKGTYGVAYVTKDGGITIDSVMGSIGHTAEYPCAISTSLYNKVAYGFSEGAFSAIFEIEGRKNRVRGMMIRQFSQFPNETEFLLAKGVKFKITDAGVKRFEVKRLSADEKTGEIITEIDYAVRPYLRMEIVGEREGNPLSQDQPPKKGTYKQISQEEAMKMMGKDDGHVIVDVRRKDEYDEGHIPKAILIPNESIGTEMPAELPDKNQIIMIYCRSGNRSKTAAQKLADMGYKNVYEFGGINTWPGAIVKI